MKYLIILSLLLPFRNIAQTVKPDLQDSTIWRLTGRKVENIREDGRKGIRFSEEKGSGLLILKNFSFKNGIIEFDVKGKNELQHSFVGIAFHLQNDSIYDAVYFRPFNFQNPDTSRRSRSVQYLSRPSYDWSKLRTDFPGKYENKVVPVPNPDGWFHVKLTVEGKKIKVFVNNNDTPSLTVEKLTGTTSGELGLWVDNTSGGSFANLTITKK